LAKFQVDERARVKGQVVSLVRCLAKKGGDSRSGLRHRDYGTETIIVLSFGLDPAPLEADHPKFASRLESWSS